MQALTKKKTKIMVVSIGAVLIALVLALSGIGIYFKLHPKNKNPDANINPLDFSIDAWDGKTVDGLNFNESYAGRDSFTKTINSAASFIHFVNEVNSGNSYENYTIYLNSSIDLKGNTINSIGTETNPFKGIFDGGYYTLYNANINGNGLFGFTGNATIKNVGLYNANTNLIDKAINTNIENVFVRMGEGVIVNEYSSMNGEHYINNSFVDSKANGLINVLNTNNSSENEVLISNSYYTAGDSAVKTKVGEAYSVEENVIKATSKDDFATWSYSKNYSAENDWCDYDYLKDTEKLNFTYPIQSGFVKVFLTGSCYESVVVVGGTYVDATDLSAAFDEADKESEAEINLLVEKIFMEAQAEVSNANVTINAIKDTTIVRGDNNIESIFVAEGGSKITLGTEEPESKTITLDGNREYVEDKELTSGAVVVADGGEVEINDNVIIKNNVNNSENGYGGAVVVYNGTKANIKADISNCSATYGGAIAFINDGNVSTASTENEIEVSLENITLKNNTATNGGAIYVGENVNLTVSNLTLENNKASENGGSIYAEGAIKVADDVVIKNNHKDELGYAEIYAKDKFELSADIIFDTETNNTAAIRITENNYVDLIRIPHYRIKLYKENISVYEEGSTSGLIFKYPMPQIVSTAVEKSTSSNDAFEVVNLPEDYVVTMNSAGDGMVSIAAAVLPDTPGGTLPDPVITTSTKLLEIWGDYGTFTFSVNYDGVVRFLAYGPGGGTEDIRFRVGGETSEAYNSLFEVSVKSGETYLCEVLLGDVDPSALYYGASYYIDLILYPNLLDVSRTTVEIDLHVFKTYPTINNTAWTSDSVYKVEYRKFISSVFTSNANGTLGVLGWNETSVKITALGWDDVSGKYVWDVVITGNKVGSDDLFFTFTPENTKLYYSYDYDGGVPVCEFQVDVEPASLGFYIGGSTVYWPNNPPIYYYTNSGSACTITFTSSNTSIVKAPSSASVSSAGTSGTTLFKNGTAVGIGTVTITATCTPSDSNYATETSSCFVTVSKGTPTITATASPSFIYVGGTSTFTYKSNVAGNFTISASIGTLTMPSSYTQTVNANTSYTLKVTGALVGTGYVSYTFTPGDGVHYNNTVGSVAITVSKIYPTVTTSASSITAEILSSLPFTYKSNVAGTFNITSSNSSVVTINSGYTKTAVANTTYTCNFTATGIGSTFIQIYFTPNDTNTYNSNYAAISVTVTTPANGVEKPTSVTSKVYTGNAITLTGADITGFDSTKMQIFSGATATEKGTYNVYIALKAGYKWMDGTSSNISLPWQITGNVVPNATLSLSSNSYVYGGMRPTPTVSSNPDYAKVTYYVNTTNSTTGGTDWSTLTSTSLNVGTYYMYAVIAESPNYEETITIPVSFSITKATPVFSVNGFTSSKSYIKIGIFSSSATTITVMSSVGGTLLTSTSSYVYIKTDFPENMSANISYSGSAYSSLGSGTITFTFTPTDTDNYNTVSHTANVKSSYSSSTIYIPTLSGSAVVGQTLTADPKTTSYTVAYQWYYNTTNSITGATAIHGATSATLTLTNDLWQKYVLVKATYQNGTADETYCSHVATSGVVQKPAELTLSHGGKINMRWYDEMQLTFTAPCEGSFVANINNGDGSAIVMSTHASIGFTWNEAYQVYSSSRATGTTVSLYVIANRTELGSSTIDVTFTPTNTLGVYAKSITYKIAVNVEKRIVPLPEDISYEWNGGNPFYIYPKIWNDDMVTMNNVLVINYSDIYKSEVGSYTVSVSLNNSNGQCVWADGTITPKTYTATITQQTLPSVTRLNLNGYNLSWTGVSKNNASIAYIIDIKEFDRTTESYITWKSISTTSTSYNLKDALKEYDGDKTSLYIFVTTTDLLGTYYKDSAAVSKSIDEIYQITLAKGEGIADILVDGVSTTSFAYIPGQTVNIVAHTQENYKFKEWTESVEVITTSKTSSTITVGSIGANATITATAELAGFWVTIKTSDETAGSVSEETVFASSGSTITVKGNTITISGVKITATTNPNNVEYTYTFSSWSNTSGAITAERTITANFTKTKKQYTVTIVKNNDSYGTISQSSVTADYGTIISASENTLTIGTTVITATPTVATTQYVYEFVGFEGVRALLTDNITILATFKQSVAMCTITIKTNVAYGTVSTTTLEVEYGATISTKDNVLTIGSSYVIATPIDGDAQYSYSLSSWGNATGIVTGDMEITANFTQTVNTYAITIAVDSSTKGTVSSTTVTSVAYGSTIEIEDNKIVIKNGETTIATITATAKSGYAFDKWVGVVGLVNGNISITANFA